MQFQPVIRNKVVASTAYHPQNDSQTEPVNLEMIKSEGGHHWEECRVVVKLEVQHLGVGIQF